jgi:membrane protein
MGEKPADECGEVDANGTGDRDRYRSDTASRWDPHSRGSRPDGRSQLPDGGRSASDSGDSADGSNDGSGDDPDRSDNDGGDADGSGDGRETDSGDRTGGARTPYPGVQSLQLTRGDIPRHRGDRPNTVTEADLAEMRERIEAFEDEIEDRTVHREELERELKGYVRQRTRRGRARGWRPYLVLLYGTAMTLGAFFFLGGLLAILAMLVIWLSTLGLYMLMVIIGVTSTALGLPGRIANRLAGLRNIR